MRSVALDIRARDVPHFLAEVMKATPQPATRLLEHLAGPGTRMRIRVIRDGQRGVTETEGCWLDVPAGTPCKWRTGAHVDSEGRIAAGTFLLWLPHLLDPENPDGAAAALDRGGEPAGVILERLGMHRERRQALAVDVIDEITGEDSVVRATAVLMVPDASGRDVAVAYAEEHLTRRYAESLT